MNLEKIRGKSLGNLQVEVICVREVFNFRLSVCIDLGNLSVAGCVTGRSRRLPVQWFSAARTIARHVYRSSEIRAAQSFE